MGLNDSSVLGPDQFRNLALELLGLGFQAGNLGGDGICQIRSNVANRPGWRLLRWWSSYSELSCRLFRASSLSMISVCKVSRSFRKDRSRSHR